MSGLEDIHAALLQALQHAPDSSGRLSILHTWIILAVVCIEDEHGTAAAISALQNIEAWVRVGKPGEPRLY